jgi:hypothetical protein
VVGLAETVDEPSEENGCVFENWGRRCGRPEKTAKNEIEPVRNILASSQACSLTVSRLKNSGLSPVAMFCCYVVMLGISALEFEACMRMLTLSADLVRILDRSAKPVGKSEDK